MSTSRSRGSDLPETRATPKPPDGYRPCVGAMIANRDGLVWIGRRNDGIEVQGDGTLWQMPQGGIDRGEEPDDAVLREVYEETSMVSLRRLARSDGWLSYDLPDALLAGRWKDRYLGQTQRWYLLAFEGPDSEIDVEHPGGGKHDPEFDAWRWVEPDALPDLVIPFKRAVYEAALAEFRPKIEALRSPVK